MRIPTNFHMLINKWNRYHTKTMVPIRHFWGIMLSKLVNLPEMCILLTQIKATSLCEVACLELNLTYLHIHRTILLWICCLHLLLLMVIDFCQNWSADDLPGINSIILKLFSVNSDQLNSTSSSNDSMSSLSSRDINNHSSTYATVTPQKNSRGIAKMGIHYATRYRPQDNM